MWNTPEVVREVGVHDFRMATEQQLLHLDGGLLGVAPGAVGIYFSGGRSASKIGSSTSSAAVMQTRSRAPEMPSGLRFDVSEVLAVDPRRALVRAALGIGMRQNVVAADLVVQGVEAIVGLCLRFRV